MKKTLTTLIKLRNKRNITQSILANEMNISRVELSVIERGKRQLTYKRIEKYIKALNNIDKKDFDLKLSNEEKSCLIEAVLFDFIKVLVSSTSGTLNYTISKSIHFNKTEITTVLPDGKIIEINL